MNGKRQAIVASAVLAQSNDILIRINEDHLWHTLMQMADIGATAFVLVAYIAILLLVLAFKASTTSRNPRPYY